ncbi:aspartyl-phosphate phosphatase Spo0E family protein [Alteribacillus sp. YIM 98480]|uniref:aspartyl-phosphate phosphatase Spo0E family protein n=1 Tax=Alteribacillus sp. YIM 98480 TaxID=2606599 RepID=UPI00131C8D0B|nr:aspartyl-phosphate phosphatase Spo0E family protein [Alteribacillus sp. YIM 98480]
MSEQSLLHEIETKREKLNSIAWNKPLFSDEVVRLSRELDQLLNKYDSTLSATKA